MFCTTGLVSSKLSAQMYEEKNNFGKLLFKQSKIVLKHLTLVTLPFDSVTPKSIMFLCYPGQMCGPSLRKIDQSILKVIDHKQKGYRGMDLQTDKKDRQTDMCKAICPLFFEGGHN